MSESASPGVVGDDVAIAAEPALSSSEIDNVLNDFRTWLEELPRMPLPAEVPAPVDLYTLVAQFTALRQEVNLQTRTSRAQQELQAQALEQLRQAAPSTAGSHDSGDLDADALLRPYVQSLIDAADAQFLAVRELGRVVETVVGGLKDAEEAEEMPMPEVPALGWWARFCGAAKVIEQQQDLIAYLQDRLSTFAPAHVPPVEAISKPLVAAYTGLQMGLQRLDRTLEHRGLQLIPALDRPFDPEQMEVIEAVADTDCSPGEVIEELRRGYLWNGRVFRTAQVRVAR